MTFEAPDIEGWTNLETRLAAKTIFENPGLFRAALDLVRRIDKSSTWPRGVAASAPLSLLFDRAVNQDESNRDHWQPAIQEIGSQWRVNWLEIACRLLDMDDTDV